MTFAPLSVHAVNALKELAQKGARPRQEFNPGVVERLTKERLVEAFSAPSPYKTHQKERRHTVWLRITDAGKVAAMEKRDG